MRNLFKKNPLRNLNFNISERDIAISNLYSYKTAFENDRDIKQVKLNIISDKLRRYLGESSKVYYSFSLIDINQKDGKRTERLNDAAELIQGAIDIIEERGLYQDIDAKLKEQQYKNSKNKLLYAIIGGCLGIVAANLKDILKVLETLLQKGTK